jgi:hypothetical protein
MFLIVEFDDQTISVVRTEWLVNNNSVRWPGHGKFRTVILKSSNLKSMETWQVSNCEIISEEFREFDINTIEHITAK